MSFKIVLHPSGDAFEAQPGESILTAGVEAGIALRYSCRSGICGTCKCKVLEGRVDHGNASLSYLSEGERREGYTMLCQAHALSDLVVEAEGLKGLAGVKPRITPCRVSKLERVAPDVAAVHVRVPMNENLLFVSGQYIDFLLPNGERRSYSIATTPSAEGVTELELHIRHLPGGLFTDRVFSGMKPRELLTMEGPFGTFFIREESSKPMVFVASGTGFAPVKAMLSHAFKIGLNKRRPIHLYWGGRTRKCLYMADLAAQWAQQYENFTFVPVLSNATEECAWTGRTGYVHQAVLDDFSDLSGHQVYACGSPLVVGAARREFIYNRGLPADEFFADEFLTALDRAATTTTTAEQIQEKETVL